MSEQTVKYFIKKCFSDESTPNKYNRLRNPSFMKLGYQREQSYGDNESNQSGTAGAGVGNSGVIPVTGERSD